MGMPGRRSSVRSLMAAVAALSMALWIVHWRQGRARARWEAEYHARQERLFQWTAYYLDPDRSPIYSGRDGLAGLIGVVISPEGWARLPDHSVVKGLPALAAQARAYDREADRHAALVRAYDRAARYPWFGPPRDPEYHTENLPYDQPEPPPKRAPTDPARRPSGAE